MSDNRRTFNRRDALRAAGIAAAALGTGALPGRALGAAAPVGNVLLFLRIINLPGVSSADIDALKKLLVTEAAAGRITLTVQTDGSGFTPAALGAYDAVIFYSTCDTVIDGGQGASSISEAGKSAFLKLVSQGKAIIVMHVGLPVVGSTPATGAAASGAAQLAADAKIFAPQLASLVRGTPTSGVRLADHHVKVKGATVNNTPMPLRMMSLQVATTGGKSKYRPVLSVLYSNGGTLLRQTIQSAVA